MNTEQLIRRELSSLVSAGRGEWASGDHPDLGRAIYRYDEDALALGLFSQGLSYSNGSAPAALVLFDAIRVVKLLSLRELIGLRVDTRVTFTIEHAGGTTQVALPAVVYSMVGPLVHHIRRRATSGKTSA